MHPTGFQETAAQRLRELGDDVGTVQLPGGPVLVGYRRDFRLRWMATRLHTFTAVATVPLATAAALEQFTTQVLDHAVAAKGGFRGMQSGVAVVAVLAAGQVLPDAAAYARQHLVRRFAAFAWPAVLDLGTGARHRHVGGVAIGGVYAGWMRRRTDAVLGGPPT